MIFQEDRIVELAARDEEAYTHCDHAWTRGMRGRLLCPSCDKIKRELLPVHIDVPIIQLLPNVSCDLIFGAGGISIVRYDLYELLSPHLSEHITGLCIGKDGKPIADYLSLLVRDTIRMFRGDRTTVYCVTRCCGFVGGQSDSPYLLRRDMPAGRCFQDRVGCLYMAKSFADRLPWDRFTDVRPKEYPVRDEPVSDDPWLRGSLVRTRWCDEIRYDPEGESFEHLLSNAPST